MMVCSSRAPQGTVLSPVLFTLCTSNFMYNSESCLVQTFWDDTAVVACIRDGTGTSSMTCWCQSNHLHINASKTKEMVVDFRRPRPLHHPGTTDGVQVEFTRTYKYLGLHLDERLDWSPNTDVLYKKLRSFNICNKLLLMFYQAVVGSAVFMLWCAGEEAPRRGIPRGWRDWFHQLRSHLSPSKPSRRNQTPHCSSEPT